MFDPEYDYPRVPDLAPRVLDEVGKALVNFRAAYRDANISPSTPAMVRMFVKEELDTLKERLDSIMRSGFKAKTKVADSLVRLSWIVDAFFFNGPTVS